MGTLPIHTCMIHRSRPVPDEQRIHLDRHSRLPAVPLPDSSAQAQRSVAACSDEENPLLPAPSTDLRREVELHVVVVRPHNVMLHEQGRVWPDARGGCGAAGAPGVRPVSVSPAPRWRCGDLQPDVSQRRGSRPRQQKSLTQILFPFYRNYISYPHFLSPLFL